MTKEMIIASNGHETRVAILEDDLAAEIFVERERNRGVVGNVYKGRVSKVLPGMQSAFVDIGLERDGFLYVSDVINTDEAFAKLSGDDDEDEEDAGGSGTARAPAAVGASPPAGRPDNRGRNNRRDDRERGQDQRIEDLFKEGQEILVQVAKEPLGTKGARLTSHVTLPGRFLVFMPTVDHIGVSRKIATREERQRLRGIVRDFREQNNFGGGVIIRTAAEDRTKDDIVADLQYFFKIWTEMRHRSETHRAPAVAYREPSLVSKLLRDLLTDDYTAIRIDHATEHQRVVEFIERIMPALAPRVKLYDKDFPIFEEYGVQAELDKALRSKVWLKSGGSIVVNQTEALVAIDVNTGRYVGKKTAGRLEDTILKTNLEAVKEIIRQIRLRDLGGIIVLDFIDMEEKKNRQKVFQTVEQELRKDRVTVQGAPGLGFRPGDRHPEAREAKSRARPHRAVPVLFGRGDDQVELDDLLRDPVGDQKGRHRHGWRGRAATGQSGHRTGAQRGRARGAEGSAEPARQGHHRQARRPPASRAVRRDVDRGVR